MKSRITRITIGRLYNLGNYEHVRYELTVEVPAGASATRAVRGLERVVAGLKPDRSIKSVADLAHAEAEVKRMKVMNAEDWQRYYGHCTGTRAEVTRRYVASFNKAKRERKQSSARQQKARALFDDLGGASQWKDAKLDWDNDEY